MRRLILTLVVATIGGAGCGYPSAPEPYPQFSEPASGWASYPDRHLIAVRGAVHAGFEVYTLTECGRAESWWLNYAAEHVVGPNAVPYHDFRRLLRARGDVVLYAEFEGFLSKPGHYGHLGKYPREFLVTRVEEFRRPKPNDCSR